MLTVVDVELPTILAVADPRDAAAVETHATCEPVKLKVEVAFLTVV